jgi:hypothetical protein
MIEKIVTIISLVITIVSLIYPIRTIIDAWNLRYLRKIFGIKKRETVVVFCSELSNPINRQMVEEREYIYLMKYGDIDAWVEYLLSMQRLFPMVNLRISSSGEALQNQLELQEHICLIGGPDYNKLTEHFISLGVTRFTYIEKGDEIVILDRKTEKEYYYTNLDNDFGYIEKIPNPYNKKKSVFLFGGCHTVGVTSAVKFFSAFSNGKSDVSSIALENANSILKNKKIDKNKFSLLIAAKKIGATISYPTSENLVQID